MVFESSSNCELSKFPNTAERVRILSTCKGKESDPHNALADALLMHHQHTTKYTNVCIQHLTLNQQISGQRFG